MAGLEWFRTLATRPGLHTFEPIIDQAKSLSSIKLWELYIIDLNLLVPTSRKHFPHIEEREISSVQGQSPDFATLAPGGKVDCLEISADPLTAGYGDRSFSFFDGACDVLGRESRTSSAGRKTVGNKIKVINRVRQKFWQADRQTFCSPGFWCSTTLAETFHSSYRPNTRREFHGDNEVLHFEFMARYKSNIYLYFTGCFMGQIIWKYDKYLRSPRAA